VFAFNFDAAGDIKIDPSQFDFSKASFILTGNSSPNISIVGSSNNPLSISLSALSLNNATISSGTVQVTDNLTLQGGILTVPSTSKLVYSGNAISGASPTSYISGKLFMKGTGSRTFPIGNAAFGYLPVTLLDVKDADTEIGFEAIAGDPGITAALPSDIQSIFTDYYWTITNGNSGSYSGGSPIQLSLNGAGNSFTDGDPVILEVGTGGTLTELGGIVANPDITSAQVTTATAQKYVLGKSEKVTVNIHRVITPNGDGQNDYLYIDGIDFYTNNTVKLVDRWGVVHFEKSNFKNYGQANPSDFDFSKLSNGNYICVVDLANGPKINPKMISVVK
jgi:gliding motility-associated-like protein